MGLSLDSSFVVHHERRGVSVDDLLKIAARFPQGESISVSAITLAELTHEIFRAASKRQAERRNNFIRELEKSIPIHPLTAEIARLVGRLDGELAAKGARLDFADLLIGATALQHGDGILTINTKHFTRIPNLIVHTFTP